MNEPIGDICILRSDDHKSWVVSICRGNGTRDELKCFQTRDEAIEFAIAERERRRTDDGTALNLHLPDDCPCCTNERRPGSIA